VVTVHGFRLRSEVVQRGVEANAVFKGLKMRGAGVGKIRRGNEGVLDCLTGSGVLSVRGGV